MSTSDGAVVNHVGQEREEPGEPAADAPRSAQQQMRPLGAGYWRLFAASTVSNVGDGVALVAYPWLASAVTRNPLLIALIVVVQRLPWLVFTLPAGVLTDRHDRRLIMVTANTVRGVLTVFVALAVLWRGSSLPGPDELDQVVGTNGLLYGCVIVATLLLGMCEVLYDNSAQTLLPSIVSTDQLETANGRLWAAQDAANQFAGPPLGSLLLAAGFAVPFFVDAASFAASAALIFAIAVSPRPTSRPERQPWRDELREGVRWLWQHHLLRSLAVVLGVLNASVSITYSIWVLYAQEVLNTSSFEFALIMMMGGVGAVGGGWVAPWLVTRLGSGPTLALALLAGAAQELVVGLVSNVPAVVVVSIFAGTATVMWNVVTVSLRQAIIPDHLLGRVNSVYRFFAWGMIPIGAFVGGAIVAVSDRFADREAALRAPWFVAGGLELALFAYAVTHLTTARLDAARRTAVGEVTAPSS